MGTSQQPGLSVLSPEGPGREITPTFPGCSVLNADNGWAQLTRSLTFVKEATGPGRDHREDPLLIRKFNV